MRHSIRRARTPGQLAQCAGAVLLLALLAASLGTMAGVAQEAERRKELPDGFRLFAGPRVVLSSNQLQCTINSDGSICLDAGTSPDDAGGWFPTGTADAYHFSSGIMIAGLTSDEAGPWALDTAGIFNMFGGARGLTPIYDSLDPDDLESWPAEAYIDDPEIFAPILLGRKTASQHDTWVQYWDGDPALRGGLDHPMGIRVTQRSMSWSYPSGNESVIYFILEFENVTDDPDFQTLNELAYFGGDDALPDAGWTYSDVYVAVGVDNDVAVWWKNFATAILPFDMTVAYNGAFEGESWWEYPPSVFYPPFFTDAPGIAAVKFLKSPLHQETSEEIGLSMMSVFGGPFFDPQTPEQLWRYLSGNVDLNLGDPACNVPAEIQTLDTETTERSVCWIPTRAVDIRTFQASGPFTLGPGESATLLFAHLVAPTVETMPDGSESGIEANASPNWDTNPPGEPSFHPGFPSARGCDPGGSSCTDVKTEAENAVTAIERGAGWVGYDGPGPAGTLYPPSVEHPSNRIDQFDVKVVPGSLLGRALVAQTVFQNSFLLGFAPDRPAFYLVPGDGNVTVIWEPSATETLGDPFYDVASDTESALYNPNYRQFDVEGYRIWRGTTRGQLELLTQFDFEETRFYDYTCETVPPEQDVGATDVDGEPVLGFAAGDTCPLDEDDFLDRATDGTLIFNNGSPGGAPGAGVSREPVAVTIDTAIVADRDVGEVRPLRDTGVPYTYVDSDVYNNFTYFYSVTAFDLNSMASGPHTLRSTMVDQSTVPRADAPEVVYASLEEFLLGDDGEPLNPAGPVPSVDPDNGTFSGPFPATNGAEQTFVPLLPRLLPEFTLAARIDSVKPDWVQQEGCAGYGWTFRSVCWRAWLTVNDSSVEAVGLASGWNAFGRPGSSRTLAVNQEVPFDPDALAAFGIPEASGAAQGYLTLDESIQFINWEGQQNRRGATENTLHGGPRWFNGTQETTANPDPTAFIKVGQLAEVDSVFIPIHHTPQGPGMDVLPNSGSLQYFGYYLAFLGMAADIRVTWSGGTITVRDVSNNVNVPFSAEYGSSWGFLNDDGDGDGTVSWWDFFCVGADAKAEWELVFDEICPGTLSLSPTPTIHSIAMDTEGAPVPTGNGFTLYLNGMRHFFLADALPPDGTEWTLRTYNGSVTASSDLNTWNPGAYSYVPIYDSGHGQSGYRSPLIPGLTIGWKVETPTTASGPTDLSQVHTVPDPYLTSSRYDLAPSTKQLMFVNLPPQATIRIYSVGGVLVDILNHEDPTGGGRAVWDVRNRNNQFVASGVYFFHVVTPEADEHVGKLTIINRSSN